MMMENEECGNVEVDEQWATTIKLSENNSYNDDYPRKLLPVRLNDKHQEQDIKLDQQHKQGRGKVSASSQPQWKGKNSSRRFSKRKSSWSGDIQAPPPAFQKGSADRHGESTFLDNIAGSSSSTRHNEQQHDNDAPHQELLAAPPFHEGTDHHSLQQHRYDDESSTTPPRQSILFCATSARLVTDTTPQAVAVVSAAMGRSTSGNDAHHSNYYDKGKNSVIAVATPMPPLIAEDDDDKKHYRRNWLVFLLILCIAAVLAAVIVGVVVGLSRRSKVHRSSPALPSLSSAPTIMSITVAPSPSFLRPSSAPSQPVVPLHLKPTVAPPVAPESTLFPTNGLMLSLSPTTSESSSTLRPTYLVMSGTTPGPSTGVIVTASPLPPTYRSPLPTMIEPTVAPAVALESTWYPTTSDSSSTLRPTRLALPPPPAPPGAAPPPPPPAITYPSFTPTTTSDGATLEPTTVEIGAPTPHTRVPVAMFHPSTSSLPTQQ